MYKDVSYRYEQNMSKNVQKVLNIYFDDVLIDPTFITDLKKGGTLFDKNFELGSMPSQYIELKIHKRANLPIPKQIRVEFGVLVNNALTLYEVNQMLLGELNVTPLRSFAGHDDSFEMIPCGIYNVDDYSNKDNNIISIRAYDNIIKLEADDGYYDASKLISKNGYATLGEIAEDICKKKGLELGSKSFLNSDTKIYVYDNSITARQYMGYIAECAGCFVCAGRDGKIYFKSIGEDTIEVPQNLFKTYKYGEQYKISKVAYENGAESFKFGNEIGNTLWLDSDNLFLVEEAQVQKIYNKMKDLTIYGFEGTAIIDPRIDIGDILDIDGRKVIYQGEMTFGGVPRANIKSKISIKAKSETTVRRPSQKTINRRVQSQINEAEGKIAQLVEETTETTNKLTQHEQTIEGITDTVQQNKKELAKDIHNNYQEIIQKFDSTVQEDDLVAIRNQVKTIQDESKYAINIAEEIQVNGVSKVKTETGYTFGNDGLIIEKTGAETNATWNEKGLEVKDMTGSQEDNLLKVGYDEKTGETIVKSKNMIVEKYFMMGTYSRMEDYENGTGIFVIGGKA